MANNTEGGNNTKEDCIDDDDKQTSLSHEEESDKFNAAQKPVKKDKSNDAPSQKDRTKNVDENQNAKGASSDLPPGPELFEVEEPPPPPPATVPGAFAVGCKTRSKDRSKGDRKTLDSQEKSSRSAITDTSSGLNNTSLPPCPEVLPIEEPKSENGQNGGEILNTDDLIYLKKGYLSLAQALRNDEELDTIEEQAAPTLPQQHQNIIEEPPFPSSSSRLNNIARTNDEEQPIPTLPQQHQTIIVEPPFPSSSSRLNTTTRTIDDEGPNTETFQDENAILSDEEGGSRHSNNDISRGVSNEDGSTVRATMIRNDSAQVVPAECVLAERQQNNQEAIPIEKSEQSIKAYLRNHRIRMGLCIILLLIIALAVAIGITVSGGSGDGDGNNINQSTLGQTSSVPSSPSMSAQPSSSPTMSTQPTSSPSISYVPTPAPIWVQVGQGKILEEFGNAIAISKDGMRVAIGTNKYNKMIDNSNASIELGRVAIYDNSNGGEYWNLTGDIVGDNENGQFGDYVAFSGDGNRIAIGGNEYGDSERVSVTGHVKVLEYKSGSWRPLGDTIIGEFHESKFGTCLALSDDGNVLAVSATGQDGLNGIEVGVVHCFKYLNGSWTGMGDPIMGEGQSDRSGHRISMSSDGRVVAIGAHHNDGMNGLNSGHVRVYQYVEGTNGTSWKKLGQDIDGEKEADRFGWSVSLSGDGSIVAGGARQIGAGGNESGGVWIYQYNNETDEWVVFGRIIGEASGDAFGHEVSLSSMGDVIAIGAIGHDGINGKDSGYVQIYRYHSEGQEWIQVGENIYGRNAGDEFGKAMSISADGTRIAVSAPLNDDAGVDSGMVQIYEMKK